MKFNNSFYINHTIQRISFLEKKYSKNFFSGKSVLDLGGGIGHVGRYFREWGANVTVYEGRKEHVETGKIQNPDIEFVLVDLENEIPDRKFDIVINWGVFYHLMNSRKFLESTIDITKDIMFLEGNFLPYQM